ncbi:creatininase family protein [Peristeroidobacter agariperforans]|uniref:creatininase family protein n=1 Tax=Peristeroidobacter agariperforans TaxID=268404 RepID=UPI00101DB561|nr:creatininase family protein [Peristeroidobacter agariperforans]
MISTTYWENCTTRDLCGLDPEQTVALLPVSAVEQHGPHLPLATDAIIAQGLVREAMQRVQEDLLVLPPMSIGHSLEHTSFAGTLSIAAEPLLAAWLEIGRSVARAGLRKLIILNTHGGNIPLVQLAALRLRQELQMLVLRANYFSFGSPPGLFSDEELRHGIHGGEMETSLLLHLRPDLVRQELLADFRALTHGMAARNQLLGPEKPIGFGWMSEDLHEHGVCGNAARGDAKRGAILLSHLAEQLAALIAECQSTPLATLRPQPDRGD